MGREIKFRAWNTNKRRMSYQDGTNMQPLIIRIDGVLALLDKDSNDQYQYTYRDNLFITDEEGGQYHPEDFILMQYTGLKDKNGKEIYEGDICRNGDYDNNAHSSLYRIEEVKYIEGEARFIGLDYNVDGTSCEVIGNIYENPELLSNLSED